jgi:predicted enzyme related to lactoylglutathione lyase
LHRPIAAVVLCLFVPMVPAESAKETDLIERVNAFRAARDAGDHELARGFLSDSPRVWYDSREGEGYPLKLGAGRWKSWDEHFNGSSELGPWTVEANSVWALARETNDYFRLLERADVSRYRITYFFDGEGKIEGYMISAAHPGQPSSPRRDRFEEFEDWVGVNHPQEWEYLRPGGELNPTGDRAPRTRLLLEAWRKEAGLPVLGGGRNSHGVFTGEQKSVLYVADVEKSAEFFEKVLGFGFDGFAERDGRPYYAEMLAGGTKFGLHEPTSPGQESRIGEQRLYFRIRDLSAHRVRVAARGGEPGAIKKTDWMDMFVVRDPDGHEIVFAFTDAEEHSIDPW